MMTKRDVLSMAFRVLGVWYLISVIMSIPDLLFYMYPPADIPDRQMLHIGLKGFFIDYAVLLALACILMGAADGLARRFVHDDAVINIPVGVNLRDVFRMLLKVIGLAIVAVNLPAVIRLVSPLFQKFHMISDWSALISSIVAIIIGTYLLLGAWGLVEFAMGREVVARRVDND